MFVNFGVGNYNCYKFPKLPHELNLCYVNSAASVKAGSVLVSSPVKMGHLKNPELSSRYHRKTGHDNTD